MKNRIRIILVLLLIPVVLSSNTAHAYFPDIIHNSHTVGRDYEDSEGSERWIALSNAVNEFEDVIKIVTNFMFAFAILNGMICFIITILRFASSGTHPMHRRQAIVDLGLSAVTTALLGAVKVISTLMLQIVAH